MVCEHNEPVYANPSFRGVKFVGAKGDGYTIEIAWHQAWPRPNTWEMVYNIFYSTIREDVFDEGVKYVIAGEPTRTTAGITELTPGDIYYFAVRAAEFEPGTVQLSSLPQSDGGYIYPESLLRYNITAEDILIPITDADQFPPIGIVQIGSELIGYSNVDIPDGYLVSSLSQRGMYGTEARQHTTYGFDGYTIHRNPFVRHFSGFSDQNINVQFDVNKFEHKYASTADGYKEKTDLVYTDAAATDEANSDLLSYDYSGYHRNSPLDLLSGKCLGTYILGEFYCADGYDSVGMKLRGVPLDDQVNMREEVLLETTGELCTLFRRMTSGKVSQHYDSTRENTTHRGLDTYGTDLVVGYEMFWNDKRNDGKIWVRFGPTSENIERQESGLENIFIPNCWALTFPFIKDGDFIIRYNKHSGEEEFRYELQEVTRNVLIDGQTGAQKFTAVRVRKTDPIAQVKAAIEIGTMPQDLTTSIGMVAGKIPPHVHTIKINENITSLSQINQVTSVAAGHNHEVVNGVLLNVLSHSHSIILP